MSPLRRVPPSEYNVDDETTLALLQQLSSAPGGLQAWTPEADLDTQADDTEDNDEETLYTAEEIEEAETAFAAQQRSFKEARDLLRRVKTARQFDTVDEDKA